MRAVFRPWLRYSVAWKSDHLAEPEPRGLFSDEQADWQAVWQCASPFSLSSIAGLSGTKREIV